MLTNYDEVIRSYSDGIRDLHNLMATFLETRDKQSIKKIKRKISKLINMLKSDSKIFKNPKLTISQVKLFMNKVVKPVCSEFRSLVPLFLKLIESKQSDILSKLLELHKSLYDFGCDDISRELFNHLIKRTNDLIMLSDLLDLALECGYLDLALKITKKMHENGSIIFGTAYNEALARYLLGDDIGSLSTLKEIMKKYGLRHELFGLLSAIYIALGEFNNAKEILRLARGKG